MAVRTQHGTPPLPTSGGSALLRQLRGIQQSGNSSAAELHDKGGYRGREPFGSDVHRKG